MLLTPFTVRSQDTTDNRPVVFPFWMAREIAFDLNELEYLRATDEVNSLQLVKYEALVNSLQEISEKKDQQLTLQKKIADNWRVQYEAEEAKKPKFSTWEKIGTGAAAFLVGFFVGSIQ